MTEIRDEPTVEQTNENTQNWFAEMAFNALFRDSNPDRAYDLLGKMSDKKLLLLVHTTKKLQVMAEAVYRRRARKGGAK